MRKFSRQIRYDIQTGILLAWKDYSLLILVVILIIFAMYNKIYSNAIIQNRDIQWVDYLSGFFMGMKEFSSMDRNISFNIPIEWFLIQVGFYLTIAKYPLVDFKERGYQFLIRSGSKRNWWYSKCIWVCIHTLVYYGVIYLTTMIVSGITGKLYLWNVQDIWGLQMNRFSPKQLILTIFIMPVLIAMASGMLEMVLSFIWNPLLAVISMLVVCVASAYWFNPLLPGNYIMLLRNKWLFSSYNISLSFGIIYSIVVGIISAVGGYYYFLRYKQIPL